MSRNWTPQQKNAIYATDGSVLVSAAAGSGKTAVLVERVIKLITREKNPLDVGCRNARKNTGGSQQTS